MIEPDPEVHHIFATFADAQAFYELCLRDESLTEDARDAIRPPRQALGDRWIMDKVN